MTFVAVHAPAPAELADVRETDRSLRLDLRSVEDGQQKRSKYGYGRNYGQELEEGEASTPN